VQGWRAKMPNRSLIKTAIVLVLVTGVSACGSRDGQGGGFLSGFFASNAPPSVENLTADQIYQLGEAELVNGNVDAAVQLFSDIRNLPSAR